MDNRLVKEMIREWLLQRRDSPEPLPAPEQIRREVGWSTDYKSQHASTLSAQEVQPVVA